jgi:hypothetical protein
LNVVIDSRLNTSRAERNCNANCGFNCGCN